MRQAPLTSPQGSMLCGRKCPTGCACGPTPPCEAGEFLQSQPSSNIIAWNKRRWGASATAAGCPMDGERGQARAFSRGARGGNPSQKIDRVAKQKRRSETARASLLPVGLSGSGPQLFGTPWQAQRRRLFLAVPSVPSVESRCSTVLHLAVQTANTPAASGDEKEGKEGMHQAGKPRGQHGCPKSHGLDEVLGVGFPDFSQMCGQWIHQYAEVFSTIRTISYIWKKIIPKFTRLRSNCRISLSR